MRIACRSRIGPSVDNTPYFRQPPSHGQGAQHYDGAGGQGLHAARPETREAILAVQRDLFKVGSELATAPVQAAALPDRINGEAVSHIEEKSRALEASRPMPKDFILPGATLAAAHLDQARAVARRCERRVAALHRNGWCRNEHLLVWMNRLSDYLWLLARSEEYPS